MTSRDQRVLDLFERASDLVEPERSSFLQAHCSDEETRRRVERMLDFDSGRSLFLEAPTKADGGAFVEELNTDGRVGSYRIEERIASGGMGTVYAAIQDEPRRRVALKVLRSGWCDEAALRRFRFEAEVLGRLRHPGIAQIHEAGVEQTAAASSQEHPKEPFPGSFEGWPWFAMEFVEDARPITEYADGAQLGLQQRLELFGSVCDAVQYGHQRGVVHRDLKPSNVLVDGSGRPKVIDFGLATLQGPDQGASLELTRAGSMLGTLTYMSPEHFRGDGVDTRSDVYSLGVILCELLCGRPPFDLASTPVLEAARRVEQEPIPDPRTLRPDLPRELGWVLQRALAKEPDRRYPSVRELASDLRRFLRHEALSAGPPSKVYRFRKFVQRNRLAVGAAASISAVVVAGVVISGISLVRASDEAEKFRTINSVLEGMFTSVLPEHDGHDVRAIDLLDRARLEIRDGFAARPEVQASLAGVLAECYLGVGSYGRALALSEEANALVVDTQPRASRDRMRLLRVRLRALDWLDRNAEASALIDEIPARSEIEDGDIDAWLALRMAAASVDNSASRFQEANQTLLALEVEIERELGAEASLLQTARDSRIVALLGLGQFEEAEATGRMLLEQAKQQYGESSFRTATLRLRLGSVTLGHGRPDVAIPELERAVADLSATAGVQDPNTLVAMQSLGIAYHESFRAQEASELLRNVAAEFEKLYGPEHGWTIKTKGCLATALTDCDRLAEAEECLRSVLEIQRRVRPADDLFTVKTVRKLGLVLMRSGDLAGSRELLEQAYEATLARLGPDHFDTARTLEALATIAVHQGRLTEAATLFDTARAGLERSQHPRSRILHELKSNQAALWFRQGRTEDALALMEEVARFDELHVAPDFGPRLVRRQSQGAALVSAGHLERAEQVFRDGLELGETHFAPRDPTWIVFRRVATEAFARLGERADALALIAETIADAEMAADLPWPDMAESRLVYAVELLHVRDLEEAAQQALRARDAYLEGFGPGHEMTGRCEHVLGQVEAALAELD